MSFGAKRCVAVSRAPFSEARLKDCRKTAVLFKFWGEALAFFPISIFLRCFLLCARQAPGGLRCFGTPPSPRPFPPYINLISLSVLRSKKKKIHPWERFANGSARTRDFNKKISASAQFIIQISITPIWEIMKLMMVVLVIMWEA